MKTAGPHPCTSVKIRLPLCVNLLTRNRDIESNMAVPVKRAYPFDQQVPPVSTSFKRF